MLLIAQPLGSCFFTEKWTWVQVPTHGRPGLEAFVGRALFLGGPTRPFA